MRTIKSNNRVSTGLPLSLSCEVACYAPDEILRALSQVYVPHVFGRALRDDDNVDTGGNIRQRPEDFADPAPNTIAVHGFPETSRDRDPDSRSR